MKMNIFLDSMYVNDLKEEIGNLVFSIHFLKTPLHIAAENGHKECIGILIQNGADADAKDVRIFDFFLILTSTHKEEERDCLKETKRCEE